jgi:hypothetical protein
VEQIIGLLGKEPPLSLVSRLIKTLNDAIECKRGTTERLSTSVSRFWGLASTHLMLAQASQDYQLGEMLAIVLINNSTLDANTLASAKLELIRTSEACALDQIKTVSESPFNSRQRSEMMKPSIIKIKKVSKFLEKFVNAVRSLTRQNCCRYTSIQAGHRSKRCPQTLIHRLHKLPPTPQRKLSQIYSRIL